MAWHVFPTETPVGTFFTPTPCNYLREYQLARWIRDVRASPLESFVYSGFDLSSFSSSTGYAATGVAIVDGYRIYSDATVTISGLSSDATYYVWVQMTYTGSLVTSAAITTTTVTTPPSNSVLIGKAVKSGGSWTSVESSVKKPQQPYAGSYTGDSAATRFIFLGYTPKLVYIDTRSFSNITGGTTGLEFNTTDNNVYSSTDSHVVPIIGTFGFTVSDGVSTSLNYTGGTYRYLAWF